MNKCPSCGNIEVDDLEYDGNSGKIKCKKCHKTFNWWAMSHNIFTEEVKHVSR